MKTRCGLSSITPVLLWIGQKLGDRKRGKTENILILLLAVIFIGCVDGAEAQVPIPVRNYSFESPSEADGAFSVGGNGDTTAVTDWTIIAQSGNPYYAAGVQNPLDTQYPNTTGSPGQLPVPADGGQFAYLNTPGGFKSSLVSSDLGAALRNSVYTLTVALGRRLDLNSGNYTIELLVGGTPVATGTLSGLTIRQGAFADLSVSYRTPSNVSGDLQIVLTHAGIASNPSLQQGNFGNVRLTVASANSITYTVSPSAGVGGGISPSSARPVGTGGAVTFAATPDRGYAIDQWLVNGVVAQAGGTNFTLSDVTANASVHVTFVSPPNAPLLLASYPSKARQPEVVSFFDESGGYDGFIRFRLKKGEIIGLQSVGYFVPRNDGSGKSNGARISFNANGLPAAIISTDGSTLRFAWGKNGAVSLNGKTGAGVKVAVIGNSNSFPFSLLAGMASSLEESLPVLQSYDFATLQDDETTAVIPTERYGLSTLQDDQFAAVQPAITNAQAFGELGDVCTVAGVVVSAAALYIAPNKWTEEGFALDLSAAALRFANSSDPSAVGTVAEYSVETGAGIHLLADALTFAKAATTERVLTVGSIAASACAFIADAAAAQYHDYNGILSTESFTAPDGYGDDATETVTGSVTVEISSEKATVTVNWNVDVAATPTSSAGSYSRQASGIVKVTSSPVTGTVTDNSGRNSASFTLYPSSGGILTGRVILETQWEFVDSSGNILTQGTQATTHSVK
jgi:hypothetical protein